MCSKVDNPTPIILQLRASLRPESSSNLFNRHDGPSFTSRFISVSLPIILPDQLRDLTLIGSQSGYYIPYSHH